MHKMGIICLSLMGLFYVKCSLSFELHVDYALKIAHNKTGMVMFWRHTLLWIIIFLTDSLGSGCHMDEHRFCSHSEMRKDSVDRSAAHMWVDL